MKVWDTVGSFGLKDIFPVKAVLSTNYFQVSTSQDEVLGEGKAGGEEDPSGEACYTV